jgi:hypothetical protein
MNIYGMMFDSVTPAYIPSWSKLTALYINGRYAASPNYRKGHIYIDVNGSDPWGASILDVETGDATPNDVVPWLRVRNKIGQGVIYCNRDTLPVVQENARGLDYFVWLATLDGTIPESFQGGGTLVAVQAFSAEMIGINVDMSLVVDLEWWNSHADVLSRN